MGRMMLPVHVRSKRPAELHRGRPFTPAPLSGRSGPPRGGGNNRQAPENAKVACCFSPLSLSRTSLRKKIFESKKMLMVGR